MSEFTNYDAGLWRNVAPPDDPEVRAALARERPRIDRVRALEHAGLAEAARSLAEQIRRAPGSCWLS